MEQMTLLRETRSVAELTNIAVSSVVNGEVDPITAYVNISRMEAVIKAYKDNVQVRDITLNELSKYSKNERTFGDCSLEIRESGVRYDFSECGDEKLADMYATKKSLDADIKERETMLKNIPTAGIEILDEDSGEITHLYPPAKSSKTTIYTTFKKS